MGAKNLLLTFALIMIFTIAMVNFGVQFGVDNNSAININNDSAISTIDTNTRTNINSYNTETNGTITAFDQSSIAETSQSGTLVTGSVFKNPFKTPFVVLKDIFGLGYTKIFGGDSSFGVIFGIITSVIGVIIFMAIFKLWKGGNDE